ncbi:MAG: HAD family phosphatase [Pseudomonadales bacterium]
MVLAIFDLDETLIATDSDHAWGEFVADKGLVDAEHHRHINQAFFADYKRGTLDIDAYMRFSCSVLAQHDMDVLRSLRAEFLAEYIKPMLLPKAISLVESHREKGDCLVVVTATIEFITSPIVEYFGIKHLIAPTPEIRDGRYTGEIVGIPSFKEGKVIRIKEWLSEHDQSLEGSFCYSDSKNDLPMLELVDNPHVVDPDPELLRIAKERAWPVLTLRG